MSFRIRPLFLVFGLAAFLVDCGLENPSEKQKFFKLYGEAQGTSYTIQIVDSELKFTKHEIDSILHAFDLELSTYIESSFISSFNSKEFRDTLISTDSKFSKMLELSEAVFRYSNGLFDPSIKPLVDLYGFDSDKYRVPDQTQLNSVMEVVDYSKGKHYDYAYLGDSTLRLKKYSPSFQLDFNAIAQGYAVDVLMDFIQKRGHKHIYIELGGEIALKGRKFNEKKWKIGIEAPIEDKVSTDRKVQKVFSISDRRIATSGNYRKYFELNGNKYAHTINPKTGMQNRHNLLSATVFSESCALSDAFATTFMVLGMKGTKQFLKEHPELKLDVFLIYSEENKFRTYATQGLNSSME